MQGFKSLEPLQEALRSHTVSAKVVDVDHVQKSLLRVETDYIIEIKGQSQDKDFTFLISKTYHHFRSLCNKLKDASELATAGIKEPRDLTKSAKFVVKYVDAVCNIIESEPVEYFAKVNYSYVKKLSAERSRRLNDALSVILNNFPDGANEGELVSELGIKQLVREVERFFLTDHVIEEGQDVPEYLTLHEAQVKPIISEAAENVKKEEINTPVAADQSTDPTIEKASPSFSTRTRRSVVLRKQDLKQLEKMGDTSDGLVLEENEPVRPSLMRQPLLKNPKTKHVRYIPKFAFFPLIVVLLIGLGRARHITIQISADFALLVCFVCLTMGMQLYKIFADKSRPKVPKSTSSRNVHFSESIEQKLGVARSLALIRKSMSSSGANRLSMTNVLELEAEIGLTESGSEQPRALIQSPLKNFPPNGDPEKELNCSSASPHEEFNVRGANYLVDRVKIPSGPMLLPCRGADLLLTDECPENVGRSSEILGGRLREKPTFLINFRLPWGVLILFYEIPEKFIPYIKKGHDPEWAEKDVPSIDQMTPAERCAARFFMADDEQKKNTLKILPKVVIGPWIVKSVVGSKPGLLGRRIPVKYIYQPTEGKDKQLYLEADLDIVASAAARKILSVVKGYAHILTIDLGFLIEGNQPDELPEQMLIGTRLHSLDPMTASLLPPMPQDVLSSTEDDDSDVSDDTNR